MHPEALYIHARGRSTPVSGTVPLHGAKNSVLVSMAATLLADGVSELTNIPLSDDVRNMSTLLQALGAQVHFDTDTHSVRIDTRGIRSSLVPVELMHKMRASVLVMGPLLARFGTASVALPGGCRLGARPIDFHLRGFARMGAQISTQGAYIQAHAPVLHGARIVLPYPSVGATENILMAAVRAQGPTYIINAALEPEVLDLVRLLQAMGAHITVLPSSTMLIEPVAQLHPVNHRVMMDRLEAGTLLLATCITGGQIHIPDAPWASMELFLYMLQEMGHDVQYDITSPAGVSLRATDRPRAVSFKTMPYPGFPTDLQAQTMAALSLADGVSVIEETVFENRMLHVRELSNMGAQIDIRGTTAIVTGVEQLYGAAVIASDIRAAAGLVIAGLGAQGTTVLTGTHHLYRGYESLVGQLQAMGARIELLSPTPEIPHTEHSTNI